jgi:hypothetical protein
MQAIVEGRSHRQHATAGAFPGLEDQDRASGTSQQFGGTESRKPGADHHRRVG